MSLPSDPYTQLHGALVRAAATAPVPRRSRWSRLRRWSRAHVLVSVVVVAGVAGGSTAAAVMLKPEPSRSIEGAVPAGVSVLPERYRAFVSPQLQMGTIGWCAGVTFTRRGHRVGGAGACQPTPRKGDHRMVEVQFTLSRGDAYRIVVTDDRIAALAAPRGRLISPVADRTAPNGWKMAVFGPVDSGSERAGMISSLTPTVAAGSDSDVVAYDRDGHVVRNVYRGEYSNFGTFNFRHRAVPPGLCPFALPGVGERSWNEWSLRTWPRDGTTGDPLQAVGRSFLPCAEAEIYGSRHQRASAHLLVDAASLGSRRAAGLAGARPVRGFPGTVAFAEIGHGLSVPSMRAEIAYARRVGNAWLIIEAPSAATAISLLQTATLLR